MDHQEWLLQVIPGVSLWEEVMVAEVEEAADGMDDGDDEGGVKEKDVLDFLADDGVARVGAVIPRAGHEGDAGGDAAGLGDAPPRAAHGGPTEPRGLCDSGGHGDAHRHPHGGGRVLRVQLSDASTASSDDALLEASAEQGTAWDLPRPPEAPANAIRSLGYTDPDVRELHPDACPVGFLAIRDKFFAGEIDGVELQSQLRAIGVLAAERHDPTGMQGKHAPT